MLEKEIIYRYNPNKKYNKTPIKIDSAVDRKQTLLDGINLYVVERSSHQITPQRSLRRSKRMIREHADDRLKWKEKTPYFHYCVS